VARRLGRGHRLGHVVDSAIIVVIVAILSLGDGGVTRHFDSRGFFYSRSLKFGFPSEAVSGCGIAAGRQRALLHKTKNRAITTLVRPMVTLGVDP
jgi:hypothetical protein